MRIAILFSLSLALAACGSGDAEGDFTTDDGDTGTYRIDAETGQTSMRIETEDGETTLLAGADVAPDLPDGWSVYPGAEVANAINVSSNDGGDAWVTMTVEANGDAVIAHYRAEAEAAGYPIDTELTTTWSKTIVGEKDDGSNFSVSVVEDPEGGPSTVQLTLSSGQ